jgi:hypothetical protein
VLIESVEHHIAEEEDGWFPKVRDAMKRKDLQDLGERMEREREKAPRRPEEPGALKKVLQAVVA